MSSGVGGVRSVLLVGLVVATDVVPDDAASTFTGTLHVSDPSRIDSRDNAEAVVVEAKLAFAVAVQVAVDD